MIAEFVLKIPMFFLTVWLVRYLGAQNYGKFSFAFTFVALFTIFADFGLSTLTTREIAKNRSLAKKYVENLLTLKSILGSVTFALIFLLIQFMGKPPDTKILVYLAAIFVIVTSFTAFFQSVIQAFEKMEYLVISRLVYSANLFLVISSIILLKLNITTLMKGYICSAVMTLIVTLVLVRKKFVKFWLEVDTNFWRKILTESWPFGLIGLLGSIYFQIRIIQINLISGDIETGWYSAAYQFILVLTTLVGTFFSALFPTLSKEYGKSKNNFYKIVDFVGKRVIILSFIFCLFLFLAGKKMILLLYGPNYSRSINMLRLSSISAFISFVNITYSEALRIINMQKEYLKSVLCGVLLNLSLNFPLITLWGGLGASLAAIFSSSLVTILVMMKFRRFKKIDLQKAC